MARPTYDPINWDNDGSNSEKPSAGLQTDGFQAGMPVPDKLHNSILRRAMGWLRSFQSSALSYCTTNTVFVVAPALAWVGDLTLASIDYLALSYAQITSLTGANASLFGQWVVAHGGAVTAVQLDTPSSNATNGTYAFAVLIYDALSTPTTPLYQAWTITGVTGDGEQTLAFDAGSSSGFSASTEPLQGPVAIVAYPIVPGGGTYVRVESIRITFAVLAGT